MAPCRDSKGRFCKATVTNNKLNEKKENDVMMNAKERRMETLRENGIDTSAFFDLSLRIPLNADVRITVNGKEMTIGQPVFQPGISSGGDYAFPETCVGSEAANVAGSCTGLAMGVWDIDNDPIAQKIMENGYVKNSKLFRRFIFAHTMKLLNYKNYKDPNRIGWECAVKDLYGYNYQFEMMLEEIRVLGILQREDKEAFEERVHFFNGNVVVDTLRDYYNRLKKYINKQMRDKQRCYKGQPYVKLSKYGSVLIKNLRSKVYDPIEHAIADVEYEAENGTYGSMYYALKKFMDEYYNKLPYETTKCAQWKDSFKGAGAYYSLQNAVRFHECFITDEDGSKYYGLEADKYLHFLLDKYKDEVWRFHEVLKRMIRENNFDLGKSIAEGHNAPETSIDRREKSYDMC